ncbi:MAG TPA: MFS transporter [Kiritimatiellia bacterium]|nr:MFS transporter [Kiritimatiellia bacterium]
MTATESSSPTHRAVRRCCHLGMFIQAMVINLTPLFFIPLRAQYELSFEQLGRLVLVNFFTQMAVDLLCTAVVDRFGLVKPLTVAAQALAAVGLWLFAAAPLLFPDAPYHGLLLGTVVFSMGCGLLEVLISPIIHAVPSTRKEADMALLHAFYPIGKVAVIAVTAVALFAFGHGAWGWIAVAWSVVPLLNTFGFLAVKLPPLVHESQREKTRTMARTRFFWLALFGILLAGAAEVTLAQWTSAYAQTVLGFSQLVSDGIGFGLFGAMMIVGRLWFGLHGAEISLRPLLITGALLAAVCYAVMALSPWPILALAACILAGLFVSLLWPGIVALGAAAFPRAGISLFALLAAFGDTGCGIGPWLVGYTADHVTATAGASGPALFADYAPAQAGLRTGFLLAALFPLALAPLLWRLKRRT